MKTMMKDYGALTGGASAMFSSGKKGLLNWTTSGDGASKSLMSTGRKIINVYFLLAMFLLPFLFFMLVICLVTFTNSRWPVIILFTVVLTYIMRCIYLDMQPMSICGVFKAVLCPCMMPRLDAPNLQAPGLPELAIPGLPEIPELPGVDMELDIDAEGPAPSLGETGLFLIYLFWLCMFAAFVASVIGSNNRKDMDTYVDLNLLNTYEDVDPSHVRGVQIVDAGRVMFKHGSHLNVSMGTGFRDRDMYCVTPIVWNGTAQAVYDVWAVGMNCCNGTLGNFECPYARSVTARGGLRQLDSKARGFYRLAVQQAEAAFGIKASHPIFFHWEEDPFGEAEGLRRKAAVNTGLSCGFFFIVQACIVGYAALSLMQGI